MARIGLLLAAIAALAAALVPSAHAGTFATDGFGMAGAAPGPNLPAHANRFFRDGLASDCGPDTLGGSPTTTPGPFAYKTRAFTSTINESACVSVTVTAPTCTGTDAELMSETYSPAYNPANITENWIGDMGNSPPGSYSFVVPAGARFETVVDEVDPAANCGGVDLSWSSDRPWAQGRPAISGIPAVGRSLSAAVDAWPGDPAISRQWRRCDSAGANCDDIPGATGSSYAPMSADIGNTIALRETATDNGLASTSESRATAPVFIVIESHEGESLGAGDLTQKGRFTVTQPPSSCATPKATPAVNGIDLHVYDSFPLTSLVNEPACIHAVGGLFQCFPRQIVAYDPSFNPLSIGQNYLADDAGSGGLAYTLAPGHTAQHVVVAPSPGTPCLSYDLVVGADAPFATARPAIIGPAVPNAAMTTSDGTWSGSPSFTYGWRRCDASGGDCTPIDGATSAAYTPTADDIGHTLRTRVTATQVNSASADSAASAVIAEGPAGGTSAGSGGGPGGVGPAGGDRTPPKAKLGLARTTLQKVVKKGFIPVTATCDEACTINVRADVTRKLGKRLGGVKIASGKGTGPAGRRKTLKLKLTRKARKALRRQKSVAFTLNATATDVSGNRGSASKKAKVKRKR